MDALSTDVKKYLSDEAFTVITTKGTFSKQISCMKEVKRLGENLLKGLADEEKKDRDLCKENFIYFWADETRSEFDNLINGEDLTTDVIIELTYYELLLLVHFIAQKQLSGEHFTLTLCMQ